MTELALIAFVGFYTGKGVWHDSVSQSKPYHVEMKIEALPNAQARLWFKHLFYEENNSVIEQSIEFTPENNGFFSISLPGTPLKGTGYCSKDICHYTIPIPENNIEVTYFFEPSHRIRIVGSAQKNSDGNRIWWEETVKLAR